MCSCAFAFPRSMARPTRASEVVLGSGFQYKLVAASSNGVVATLVRTDGTEVVGHPFLALGPSGGFSCDSASGSLSLPYLPLPHACGHTFVLSFSRWLLPPHTRTMHAQQPQHTHKRTHTRTHPRRLRFPSHCSLSKSSACGAYALCLLQGSFAERLRSRAIAGFRLPRVANSRSCFHRFLCGPQDAVDVDAASAEEATKADASGECQALFRAMSPGP
jgi:hypothetical protein